MALILPILILSLNTCSLFSTQTTACDILNGTMGNKAYSFTLCRPTTIASSDFATLDPVSTHHLIVQCTEKNRIDIFPTAKFAHVRRLRALQIHYCQFDRIGSGALLGLDNLEYLVLITEGEIDTIHLGVSERLFLPTPQLLKVHFIMMGIRKLPGRLFCNTRLMSLTLTRNKIEYLNEIGCGENNTCCSQLKYLSLGFNRVREIQNGAFDHMKKLVSLDLTHNELDEIDENLFQHNSELTHLDLSFNHIAHLSSGTFFRLTSLQILDLEHNNLTKISHDSFQTLTNLHTLYLEHNQLTIIPDLKTLHKLEVLNLSYNKITSTSETETAFQTLTHLSKLSLSHNKLENIPQLQTLRNLQRLDLGSNNISDIEPGSFVGLGELELLKINHNEVKALKNSTFLHTPNLSVITLASNEISLIEDGTFEILKHLIQLNLSGNRIEDMKSVFRAVQSTLDLRNNKIQLFDFSFINTDLLSISLDNNKLSAIAKPNVPLKNYKLRIFFASWNKLQHFSASYFPPDILDIRLAHNNISTVHNLNLKVLLPELELVQLSNNSISEIPDSDIRYADPGIRKDGMVPLVILYGNPITCSCENNWLLYESTDLHTQYPKIRKDKYCKAVYSRSKRFSAIQDVHTMKKEQLLCETDQMCPNQCKFFYNKLSENILDCYNATWKHPLPILQENFTTIFFDGNTNVEFVLSQLLRNSPLLDSLYINNSDLTSIHKDMFKGVPKVTVLHLEENHLSAINGNEFQFTTKLEKLFLHRNDLRYISPDGFRNLHRLKLLTLHRNKLHQPHFWTMILSKLLEITFSENDFLCNCEYMVPFNQWVINNQDVKFIDLINTYCSDNQTLISHLNDTSCLEVINEKKNPLFAIVVPTVSIFLLLTVVLILSYFYSLEIKVWLYSRYGEQLFHNKDDDENKIFDAFISYANEDGEWVKNELVPRLKDYKLCIHEIDFPVGGLIAESIAYAVENSCVTVALLTPNYLQSEWCRFEFEFAHDELLENKCKRLVVVVLEQVDDVDLDSNLRAYLKTNTYLDINDALFWTKLQNALPEPQMQGETSL